MQYLEDSLIHAPTDLSRWSASPYASWMSRFSIEQPENAPEKDQPDAMLARLATRGLDHEDALEKQFRTEGKNVVNVDAELKGEEFPKNEEGRAQSYRAKIELTLKLLRAGTDIVAQATLELGPFRGHADFLVKVPGKSAFGDFHYEVWDTKLARRIKPGMVLQLCCYVDMLEAIQECQAANLVVALGNGSNERVPLVDCFDYYLAVKSAFLIDQNHWSADKEPNPADFTDHGDWSGYAKSKLDATDHLSRVARITHRQIERLGQAGIGTMTSLASAVDHTVAGIEPGKMAWLVRQADLQCQSDPEKTPAYHVLEPELEKVTGLLALPDTSTDDVFFDIEGFPLEGEGLEYLWGCTYLDEHGDRAFRDWWAHDTKAERVAFESFIDWVYDRWHNNPAMHIYHYAPYEITACKRLMGAYGTREQELDDLLRNGVFVDLYAIVTHAIQIGEPRYSIKNVERLYRDRRDTDVASGGDSVVVYDLWREAYLQGNESADLSESEVLKSIRDYNKDDCDSTLELCEWLREQKQTLEISLFTPIESQDLEPEEPALPDVIVSRHALRDRLLSKAASDTIGESERTQLETLAGVLEFHRREHKNAWWRYFERMDPANTSLADDLACLSDCKRTKRSGFPPTEKARIFAWEYSFDTDQEFKGMPGSAYLKGTQNEKRFPLEVTVLPKLSNFEVGLVVVRSKEEPPELITLVPKEIVVRADPISASIDAVVSDIENGTTERSALLDFLESRTPRISGHDGDSLIQSPETTLEDTVKAVMNLDSSCLIIQGPPGAGKSYTGSHIIAALVAEGKTVGISSNSHAAINNLLIGAASECHAQGVEGHFMCTKNTSDTLEELGVTVIKNGEIADQLTKGCVVGTTAWGFSRDDLEGAFDVLIVDEAGQVAVANLIAMSRAARNIVVMGDQRQLGQPTQGVHPAESGLSVLDYRLGDTAAVDPAHGVFLGTTYRLHPAVNAPISKHVYANQLTTAPITESRTIVKNNDGTALDKSAGIVYLPVEHTGNQQSSEEEVEAIAAAVVELTGRVLHLKDGSTKSVTIDDMLFVAPYNAQVTRLKQALGDNARVGSVDRFQGQEAPIVFLSLCSSDATASPRGMGFLFDRNRLNVAVSRAETLCVIVGHPGLAVTPVTTLENLRRVNFISALMGP